MLINWLFLFLFAFTSCSFPEPSTKHLTEEEMFKKERDKRIYAALKKFTKNMAKKGYYAAGIGEGIDHRSGKQNYLGVTFDIDSLPDIDFARKIEIEALQEFLCYINSEEGIQDYVAEYPYPLKFVHVTFVSRHRNEGLCSVANFQDEIYYTQDDPDKPPMSMPVEIQSESYEDAVRILEQQSGQ